MEDRVFERIAALGAVAVAGLSLLYAIAYLFIAPAAQRVRNGSGRPRQHRYSVRHRLHERHAKPLVQAE